MREATLNRVAVFGLLGAWLGMISAGRVADLDMFHQMALFREALTLGYVPTEDPFSYFTSVNPMMHHEWGTGALLYLLTVTFGLGAPGLMFLKYLLAVGFVIGCCFHARREGASLPVFAMLALATMTLASIGFVSTVRAQQFSFLFLLVLLLFLQEDRRGKRWWIPIWLVLHVVWLNLHAAFVLGFGLTLLHVGERVLVSFFEKNSITEAVYAVRHLIGVVVAMVGLVFVNPYGFNNVIHLLYILTLERTPYITEWRPSYEGVNAFLIIPLLVIHFILLIHSAFQNQFRNTPHVFFLIVTGWMAIFSIRFLPIFSLVWICCVPAYVENTGVGRFIHGFWSKWSNLLMIYWIVLAVYGSTLAINRQFWRLHLPTTVVEREATGVVFFPVGAVEYLAQQGFQGNLMTPFFAGSYISWKLYPDVKVSLDSRFEAAYSIDWSVEQMGFYAGQEGWQKTLYRYPTDAVLTPRYKPIEQLLLNQKTWKMVYKDDGFSIFVHPRLADQFEFVDNTGQPLVGTFP